MLGEALNTSAPLPVSSVTAAARFALDGVPSQVATPAPSDVMPVPPLPTGTTPDRDIFGAVPPVDESGELAVTLATFAAAAAAALAAAALAAAALALAAAVICEAVACFVTPA